jgi:uncharacterized membrane protein
MKRALLSYAGVLLVMLVLDALWLGVVARDWYQAGIGPLMRQPPWWGVAVLFYLVYAVGITWFGVWPQRDGGPGPVLLQAALFGFFAYATYDLTNLATLRGWPVGLAVADMAWGTLISALAALGGWWAGQRWGT